MACKKPRQIVHMTLSQGTRAGEHLFTVVSNLCACGGRLAAVEAYIYIYIYSTRYTSIYSAFNDPQQDLPMLYFFCSGLTTRTTIEIAFCG